VGKPAGAFAFFFSSGHQDPFHINNYARGGPPLVSWEFDVTLPKGHAFFQPLPLPSGVSAGAYSGVRSTSSVTPSKSGSIRDFS